MIFVYEILLHVFTYRQLLDSLLVRTVMIHCNFTTKICRTDFQKRQVLKFLIKLYGTDCMNVLFMLEDQLKSPE